MGTESHKTACVVLLAGLLAGGCASSSALNERQEYYVGRSVSANVLAQSDFRIVDDPEIVTYINLMGLFLSRVSDRPSTLKGYHVAVLDAPYVNAFAAPSGFVFVTRGAILQAENEDELAGVLAHEITHVVMRHPEDVFSAEIVRRNLQDIGRTFEDVASIWEIAAGVTGHSEAADRAKEVKEIAQITQNVLEEYKDAIDEGLKVVQAGYSKAQEYAADQGAAELLLKAGYFPSSFRDYVRRLKALKEHKGGWGWLTASHPLPEERISELDKVLQKGKPSGRAFEARDQRFERIKAKLKESTGS